MSKVNRPDNRLALCADFVRQGVAVADIGTDHAYLPLQLLRDGVIIRAVAADINEGPLARARENIYAEGAEDKIALRLSDGLQNISPDEADDIVIAGMGGEVISSIIASCGWLRDPKKHLILQPMSKSEELLRFLFENGFEILDQKCALAAGKYYTVLLCKYCSVKQLFSPADCYLGKLDLTDEISREFLKKQLKKL